MAKKAKQDEPSPPAAQDHPSPDLNSQAHLSTSAPASPDISAEDQTSDNQPASASSETEAPQAAAPYSVAATEPVPAIPPADQSPEQPKQSWLKQLLVFLFNPASKFGRFNRRLLRWTAFTAVIFALGVLTTYLLLFQPVVEQLTLVNNALQQSQQAHLQTQVEVLEARQKADQLEISEKAARTEALQLQNRLVLVQWINQTNAARAAVARKDGAAALSALRESRLLMETIYPVIKSYNSGQADALKALLELAQADLTRDSRLVQEDLDRLLSELTTLETQLFTKP